MLILRLWINALIRHDRDQTYSFPRQLVTGKLLNYFIDLLVFTVYHVDIALMN